MARSPASSTNPVRPAAAAERVRSTSVVTALVRSLRPRQWTKNLIVFAALLFGQRGTGSRGKLSGPVLRTSSFCTEGLVENAPTS